MKKHLTLLLLLLIVSCSVNSQYKTITKKGITLKYPKSWKERNLKGHLILVTEPLTKEWAVQATFDVEIHENEKDIKSFIENYKKDIVKNVNNFKILSEKEINFKGYKAVELICTGTVISLPFKWESIIMMKNGKLYKFTTTNMIGSFEIEKKTSEKIFNSIQIE